MLTSGATASIGIYADILILNLHIHIFFNIRHHIQRYERCLSLALRIKRRDTHQPVDAFLRFQITVCVLAVNLESHRFNSGFVSIQIINHIKRKSFTLRPSCIHAVKHTAPVAALRAARACVQFQDCIVPVIFTGQERTDTNILKRLLELRKFLLDIRYDCRVVIFISHLNQRQNIIILTGKCVHRINDVLKALRFLHLLIGFLRIVPESGRLHLPLQLFNLL